MTAPTAWWCPNCGHTVNAPAADQPDPEPGRELFDDQLAGPCPYWTPIGSNDREVCALVLGHPGDHLWESEVEAPVGVPVGDDTPEDGWALRTPPDEACPKCGAAFDKHERSDLFACLRGLGAVNDALMAGGPVGDDTPAPTTGEWSVHRHYGVRHTEGDTLWCHTAKQGPSPALATLVADALNRAGATPDLTALPTIEQVEAWCIEHRGCVKDEPALLNDVLDAVAALVRSAQNDTDGGTDDD